MHVICLFSCLIALTGSSRAVLNRGGESEMHLVPKSGPLFLFITYLDTDLFLNGQLCIFYIVNHLCGISFKFGRSVKTLFLYKT